MGNGGVGGGWVEYRLVGLTRGDGLLHAVEGRADYDHIQTSYRDPLLLLQSLCIGCAFFRDVFPPLIHAFT